METYTEHKLTKSQLERLSQIMKGEQPSYGAALMALERKGLATLIDLQAEPWKYEATKAGIKAMTSARVEGW
jgi:hypothetical protein